MSPTSSAPLPILIIGAGLSGLTLAQGLLAQQIPFQIYERDPAFNTRPQGYRIRLNLVGLHALQSTLPKEVYENVWSTAAEFVPGLGRVDAITGRSIGAPVVPKPTTPISDSSTSTSEASIKSGSSNQHHVHQISPPPGINPDDPLTRLAMSSRLPVDRATLRSVLLTNLKPYINLSKQFAHYAVEPRSVTAHFTDGTSAMGSLLIGADGYRSRVTKQLLGPDLEKMKPIDMGPRMIYGKSPLTQELKREMNHELKYGIRIAFDPINVPPDPTIFLETCRFPNLHPTQSPCSYSCPEDYAFWVLTDPKGFSSLVESDASLLASTSEEAALVAEKAVSGYHKSVRAVIEHQDRKCTSVWAMTCAPPAASGVGAGVGDGGGVGGLRGWKTERRVTILGDAIHPMPPTGGLGGNAAMRSAAGLVMVLTRRRGNKRPAASQGVNVRSIAGEDDLKDDSVGDDDNDGWTAAEMSEYETRMLSEAGRMVTLAHAGATGTYPLSLWKPLLGDAEEVITEAEMRNLKEALEFGDCGL